MMIYQALIRYFAFFVIPLVLVLNLTISTKTLARNSGSLSEMYVPHTTNENGAFIPDFSQMTFGDFPNASTSGYIDLSGLTNVLGFDTSRIWQAGDAINSILKLGDLAGASNVPQLNLNSILNLVGLSPNSFNLGNFSGILNNQTFGSLASAIPLLSNFSLDSVVPLYDLVARNLGLSTAQSLATSTIGDLLSSSGLSDALSGLSLNSIDLSGYALTSIPGLTNLAMDHFTKWEEAAIGQIPGLSNIPIAQIINDINTDGIFAIADLVFGPKEAHRTNTVTGSTIVGFSHPCNANSCPHVELAPPSWLPLPWIKGKQWISGGDTEWVAGGSGCLTAIEPVGRHPYSHFFKVVLMHTDEATGRADFSIFFHFSIFCGTSPYYIGPFPWLSQSEKDLIFLGIT